MIINRNDEPQLVANLEELMCFGLKNPHGIEDAHIIHTVHHGPIILVEASDVHANDCIAAFMEPSRHKGYGFLTAFDVGARKVCGLPLDFDPDYMYNAWNCWMGAHVAHVDGAPAFTGADLHGWNQYRVLVLPSSWRRYLDHFSGYTRSESFGGGRVFPEGLIYELAGALVC